MSVANAAYTGIAAWGRVQAVIGFVVGLLISIMLVAFGSVVAFSTEKRTSKAQANVLNRCLTGASKCYRVTYVDSSGTNHVADMQASADRSVGSTIQVYYDPSDPASVTDTPNSKTMGFVLIGAGLFILLVASMSLYFAMKYKEVAAIGGGLDLADRLF